MLLLADTEKTPPEEEVRSTRVMAPRWREHAYGIATEMGKVTPEQALADGVTGEITSELQKQGRERRGTNPGDAYTHSS